MAYIFCASGLVVNPDETLACQQWEVRTEQQIVEDAGLRLSQADFVILKDGILVLMIVAFGIRMLRMLFEIDPGRS